MFSQSEDALIISTGSLHPASLFSVNFFLDRFISLGLFCVTRGARMQRFTLCSNRVQGGAGQVIVVRRRMLNLTYEISTWASARRGRRCCGC